MTRASRREYAAKQRERYQHAPRAEKHRLLDEVVAVTGLRRAAVREGIADAQCGAITAIQRFR